MYTLMNKLILKMFSHLFHASVNLNQLMVIRDHHSVLFFHLILFKVINFLSLSK